MKNQIVKWIKNYFAKNGNAQTKAIIGISGGKDSTVAATLCVEALGKDRVIGVLMPQGKQTDIADSYEVCDLLDIQCYEINIGDVCSMLYEDFVNNTNLPLTNQIETNAPARIRMNVLYMVAAAVGGRVCNTSNAAEVYVGYSTKWGDGVGDFAPLRHLTVAEVIEVGRQCGLPEDLLVKPPADGMSGLTDEANLGFTYADVAKVMNGEGMDLDLQTYSAITRRHYMSLHKQILIPHPPARNPISFD